MNDPVPHPALLNTWKHHAGWIRWRVARAVSDGPAGVAALPAEMAVVGGRLMDLYTGSLSPAAVGAAVIAHLGGLGRVEYEPLVEWLRGQGEYALHALPDGSKWAVRLGPAGGRYLHLHPGRWVPNTVRVQANTLRSAVMAHAHAGVVGGDPADPAVVNAARRQYLGLPPVRELSGAGGLGAVIESLRAV